MFMSQHLSHTCVSKTNALTAKLKERWGSFQLAWEKRRLESKLETILRSAQGHESNGLPAGDVQYKLLQVHAETICKDFAQRWEIDSDLLTAQIPALCRLKRLAQLNPKRSVTGIALLLVISAPVVLFLIGIISGFLSLGFHLIGGR
jgi:hypothetical protein